MSTTPVPFKRVAIAPFECLAEGWSRCRDQYWLFVGICAAGILLGSFVPLGILMGAMMCGIYHCHLERWRGRRVTFDLLFKGCDAAIFVQTLIPSLLMMAVSIVITIPVILLAIGTGVVAAVVGSSHRDPGMASAFLVAVIVGAFVILIVASTLVGVLIHFTYPLIIDRRMRGLDALKLSVQASLAHVWGLLGVALLTVALGFAGVLCCYVGAFLVMPISFGAFTAAYVKVFGVSEAPPSLP